jgi:hypothetical protein
MLMHITLLPLSLLLGMMVLTAQADDPSVITQKLLIPLTTDDLGPIAIPTEVPRPKIPRDPIHRRLPGPSRM